VDFSRASLEAMKEDVFRGHLIDLYRRMGYQDVDHYHGPQELGKDIIMWDDVAGQRVNIAVVVKAGNITGTAAPKKGSAGEVFNQVTQAFGAPGLDPHLGDFKTDKVFVVCNGEISSSARASLKALFAGSPRSESIEFFGLERVWQLSREHFGPRALWSELTNNNRRLFDLGGDAYRLKVEASDKGTRISIGEKYPGASVQHPITMNLSARFPTTDDGQSRIAQFQQALEGRTEITLTKDEILAFEMTGALKDLYYAMREGTSPTTLTISPVTRHHGKFRGGLRFVSTSGEAAEKEIAGLEFASTSKGETAHLTAVGGPFRFVFTFSITAGAISQADFSLEFGIDGATVRHFSDWLELLDSVATGGMFTFVDYDSGNEAQLGPIPADHDRAPSSWLMKFTKNLQEIQNKAKLKIKLCEKIKGEDVKIASEIADLLSNRNPYNNKIDLGATAEGIENSFKIDWPVAMSLWSNERRFELMGSSYLLPPMVTHISKANLSHAERERLKALKGTPKGDETVPIQIDVEGDVNFHFQGLSDGYDEEPC
jgi:hypothetical protein